MSNDKIREAVYAVLQSHLLHHWCTESEEKQPLVDQLSVGPDISTGKEELELLAETIADALSDKMREALDGLQLLYAVACEHPMQVDGLGEAFRSVESALTRQSEPVVPNEQGKNRYGLDMSYFRNLINRELNRPLTDFRPDEFARVCARMAAAADRSFLQEPEFGGARQSTQVPEKISEKEALRRAGNLLNAGPFMRGWNDCCDAALSAAPSIAEKREPAQPALPLADGYMLLPRELTAANGAKQLLIGEFCESVGMHCPACDGDDDECEICGGEGSFNYAVPVSCSTIKKIWRMAVQHFDVRRPEPPEVQS